MYRQKGEARANLQALINTGKFTQTQQEAILGQLLKTFCKRGDKYIPYATNVLFPEAMARIVMKVHSISYTQAEVELEQK